MKSTEISTEHGLLCAHCGDFCGPDSITEDSKSFCCYGCATLHRVMAHGILTDDIPVHYKQFDLPEVFEAAIDFKSDEVYKIQLQTPAIHCSSCIELLEDLPQIDKRVLISRVNFESRSVSLTVKREMPLSELAYLLDQVGYPPQFNLERSGRQKANRDQRKLLVKLAVAGFCFGNTMLFSIPHYLGLDLATDAFFSVLFQGLNIVLSVVVMIYCTGDYLVSAYKAVLHKKAHINIPIAIGILAIWLWSLYEVLSGSGFGYFDSLAGLMFFLLAGRWFQAKVYRNVSFERSVHEMLPMMARMANKTNSWQRLSALNPGEVIEVKHGEVIPVNGKLVKGDALIDYGFITGESEPKHLQVGDNIYIGGRQLRGSIHLKLTSKPDMNTIWSAWQTPKTSKESKHWTEQVSRYFTPAVLIISLTAALVWWIIEPGRSLFVFSSVLIVACPCALALSTPFTYGSVQRFFSRNGFFLKSADLIVRMSNIEKVVLDKTGTLTKTGTPNVAELFNDLSQEEEAAAQALSLAGNHVVGTWFGSYLQKTNLPEVQDIEVVTGLGVRGVVNGQEISLGSGALFDISSIPEQTHLFVAFSGKIKACFTFSPNYKDGLSEMLEALGEEYTISVLSGDNGGETERLKRVYPRFETLSFNNKPEDKQRFIELIKIGGKGVVMIGDGLNDQTALSTSDLGIVVAEKISGFYPSSDGVILSESFNKLPALLSLGKHAHRILKTGLVFSVFYNVVGVSFAVAGLLNPLIAAVLMPLSSITVVVLVTSLVSIKAKKLQLA